MSILKTPLVAAAIQAATLTPTAPTRLPAAYFLQLVGLAQLGAAVSALTLPRDTRAHAIRLILEAAGGIGGQALPFHTIGRIGAGTYKGWYTAVVTDGPNAGVTGIGRDKEDAGKDLARCLQQRTRPGCKLVTVEYIANLGACTDAELLAELKATAGNSAEAAKLLASLPTGGDRGDLAELLQHFGDQVGQLFDAACALFGQTDSANDAEDAAAALQRALTRIQIILAALGYVTGADGAEAVALLLADLRHCCDSEELNFAECDRNAFLSYRAERHARSQASLALSDE
jgi:hypothetical protein